MKDTQYWIAFSYIWSGSTFIKRLWEHFSSIKEAWYASSADLLEIEGITQKQIKTFLESRKNVEPDKLFEEIEKRQIKILTIEDKDYPELLKQIYDPPTILYVKGDLNICNLDNTLAIVGSRRCSDSIIEILNKIVSDIRGYDVTIVSGMAVGVDSCAHKAALKNNLKTIAVLGSGFDHLFPPQNRKLYNEIIDGKGAVITEYYPTAHGDKFTFPARNRIISGLSKGTLIGEASLRSGALITARLCLEHNRELMCIPGLVTNPNTGGSHKILKEGAGLVTCVKDIFDHLNWQYKEDTANLDNNFSIELLDNDKKVYEILKLEPKQFDQILSESSLSFNELMVVLTNLEINGIIKQLPGQRYSKTT